ncbi:uncharacterized protein LOC113240558 [Hyposmocoma kahamanoa]|uniref:uncharacterized protein LOC113240558 n=1 Tax=Hyposmocoma kahamanoa TaxID=1477025 RepID=UPI000E6DA227|nr:uncharacterized protein LOC113240558 [Hyposmocoma kahamanoa]
MTIREKICHVRLNVIGSARARSVSNPKTTTQQTAITYVKPKTATVTPSEEILQDMSKPTSTDTPKDLPAEWTYVSVGLGVVVVALGVAGLIVYVYRRQRSRNTATPDTEHN